MVKAVALLSGGLDSSLAASIVKGEGVEILGVNFISPFFGPDKAIEVSKELEIPLKIIRFGEDYINLLYNPKYGFGKNMNPCIDCHSLMFKKVRGYMEEIGANFIVTGEVLGSRPKSQSREALSIIERESGLTGLILRPLSAKRLPLTIPEERRWIKRENLLDIYGRSRRRQLDLAKQLGITRFSTPAGGCLLTDPIFSRRLRDELLHERPTLSDLELLKVGRHFRISEKAKVIVGRNMRENLLLRNLLRNGDVLLEVKGYKGPLVLLRGEIFPEGVITAASLCARYSDGRDLSQIEVNFKTIPIGEEGSFIVNPGMVKELEAEMV